MAALTGVALMTFASGCAKSGSPVAPSAQSGGTSDLTADSAFCVDEMNRLRATIGAPPLRRSDAVEAFSTEASRVDGSSHSAHKYFLDTSGGGGLSAAENEIPWWNLSQWGSVHAVVAKGLAMEWAEGPGGGHYDNMTGEYTEAACGITVANGEVTVTQDLR